jgi:lipopolysaccharide/colanic/teichoic acid biosynthesis glycosyltransferase
VPRLELEEMHRSTFPPAEGWDGAPVASGFYRRKGKRLLDAMGAACALILLAPLLAVLAALVKITSRGPVFFRQERVGKGGKSFSVLKFRSMVPPALGQSPLITASGDPRVTRCGRFLRRHKLDELPQLWNVLKGEMSLVGPRPELPNYVATYSEFERSVLSVRPGITDPASIAYRHEEDVLGSAADPEAFYRHSVLPHKLSMNLEYIGRISLMLDLRLVFRTLRTILGRSA